ncbi:MFS transporter [Actinomadura kijaniata]|uniref:MFS transporter n=1 Tax=Actinomadura kijaniata TaxID=46161 RepID=UPI00082EF04D|nr:MFS transporter [Actinomadura kijaniata]
MTPSRAAGKADPARPGVPLRALLVAVIALYLVAETALAPFFPQLFERLYDVDDPEATGLYLWVCRIMGLVALPLWGLAARRWPLHQCVVAGLCSAAAVDVVLGFAPSYVAFTALSAVSVACNAALLLAYPAFVAECTRKAAEEQGDAEHAELAAVRSIVVVFHVTAVAATLVGAAVLALPDPRLGVSAFAVADVLLAVLILRALRRLPSGERRPVPSSGNAGGGRAAVPRRRWWLLLAQAALIGVAFDFALAVARPFFTEFAEGLGSGSLGGAVLFFLPSLGALATLPLARRCHDRFGHRLLPVAATVCAAGFVWQYAADGLPELVCGRLLTGLGLGLAQVAVEMRMFHSTGTAGPAFTAVETVRSAGLLAAPLVSAAMVSHGLALPLTVAAVALLCVAAAALPRARASGSPVPLPAPSDTAFAAVPGEAPVHAPLRVKEYDR